MATAPMQNHKPTSAPLLPNTSFALCVGILLFLFGCAASQAEVKQAKNAGYQADFATVYGETLATVVGLYPHTKENAVTGVIRTAWHPVYTQKGRTGNRQNNTGGMMSGQGGSNGLGGTASADTKRYYIRFRVLVTGGKPWRIRLSGEASVWQAGDVPLPLKGAEVPPWLKGRSDALRVAIYERLKEYAVKIEAEIPVAQGPIISVKEPTEFGDIPAAASSSITALHRALRTRNMDDLRALMFDDMQWNRNEVGSSDVAIALWQADTASFDILTKVLEAGCTSGDAQLSVSCPKSYAQDANFEGHRAIFEKRGKFWKLAAFWGTENR